MLFVYSMQYAFSRSVRLYKTETATGTAAVGFFVSVDEGFGGLLANGVLPAGLGLGCLDGKLFI